MNRIKRLTALFLFLLIPFAAMAQTTEATDTQVFIVTTEDGGAAEYDNLKITGYVEIRVDALKQFTLLERGAPYASIQLGSEPETYEGTFAIDFVDGKGKTHSLRVRDGKMVRFRSVDAARAAGALYGEDDR